MKIWTDLMDVLLHASGVVGGYHGYGAPGGGGGGGATQLHMIVEWLCTTPKIVVSICGIQGQIQMHGH